MDPIPNKAYFELKIYCEISPLLILIMFIMDQIIHIIVDHGRMSFEAILSLFVTMLECPLRPSYHCL